MQLSKSHLRATALLVGGAAVGALGTAGALDPVSAPLTGPSAVTSAELAAGGAAEPIGAPAPTEGTAMDASGTSDPAVRRGRQLLGSSAAGGATSIDPRYLASPLSERFAQTSPGASNPGRRGGQHRDLLSNMIAAILPTEETTRTVVLGPRINPPPDDETGDNEEPCEGDCDPVDPPVDPPVGPPGGGGGEPPAGVPEIDADLLGTGLLLLIGGALVLASRRLH